VTYRPEEPLVDTVATPDLIGRTVTQAKAILESWQLDADVISDPGAEGSPGEVVMQVPVPGDMVPPGFAVRIYIVPETAAPAQPEPRAPITEPEEPEPHVPIAPPPSKPDEPEPKPEPPVTPPVQPPAPIDEVPSDRPEPGDL
jgi:beta-lactam-binding protein with PASTA domain